MKRIFGCIAAMALVLGVMPTSASAQLANFPVTVSPHHGTGLGVGVLYGRGLNTNSRKSNAFGAGARLGLGKFNIAAGAVSVSDVVTFAGEESKISFAGQLEFVVLQPVASPIAISIFGGAGTMSDFGTVIPFGVGIGISPPMVGASVEIWAAPRYQIFSPDGGGGSVNDFGASGGVRIGLPGGLGFSAAIDWVNVEGGSPLLFGATIGYRFTLPGLPGPVG